MKRHYRSTGKGLPAATREAIREIATRARYSPHRRGPTGLPKWERGVVYVDKANWRKVIGGLLIQLTSDGKSGMPSSGCYIPCLMDEGLEELDDGRPLYVSA